MEQYPSDNFIPQREPNEVTLEYVAEPKPYVAYYVQDRPLPGRKPETAAQEPPAKTRRKGHRGLKIFLICLAAVLVLAGGLYAAWWFGLLPDRFYGGDHGDYYDNPGYYYYYGELDESAEPELPVSADGTVSAPREPVYTKNELGDRYGMRSASALGKEWYEHSAGWCGYLKGKNAVEIGKLSADGTDADLKALCTISVTDLQKAVLKAMAEQ